MYIIVLMIAKIAFLVGALSPPSAWTASDILGVIESFVQKQDREVQLISVLLMRSACPEESALMEVLVQRAARTASGGTLSQMSLQNVGGSCQNRIW